MAPQRIASLLSSGTEMLYGLGLGDRVVAVSHECDYPAEVAAKPRVTGTLVDPDAPSGTIDEQVQQMVGQGEALYQIDVEQLAALRPELIVTQAQCDVCAVRFEDVITAVETVPELRGARVVALNPQHYADIFADVRRVAEAAGCPDEGQRYAAALEERVAAIEARTAELDASARPRVAAIEWTDPVMIAGNWMPEMIRIAGGTPGITTAGEHSPYVPWEQVLQFDPEVVLVAPCGFDLPRTLLESRRLPELPGWSDISAVRGGRVYAADGNAYFNRSGPRMVESLELLAHLVQPQLFPPPAVDGAVFWQAL